MKRIKRFPQRVPHNGHRAVHIRKFVSVVVHFNGHDWACEAPDGPYGRLRAELAELRVKAVRE